MIFLLRETEYQVWKSFSCAKADKEQNNKRNIFIDAISVKLHDALIANEFSLNFNNTNNKFCDLNFYKNKEATALQKIT